MKGLIRAVLKVLVTTEFQCKQYSYQYCVNLCALKLYLPTYFLKTLEPLHILKVVEVAVALVVDVLEVM